MSSATNTSGPTALRNLTGAEFTAFYGCDRFSATVLSNRFGYIIEQMVSRILTTALSRIIRIGSDFAVALLGPPEMSYPMISVSNIVPLFVGSLPDGVRISFEEYGIEKLRPGDVLMVNDYFRVGTHCNDVCFLRPIFDGNSLIAVLAVRAHLIDMGGIAPGGFQLGKRNIFEDGLRLPPLLLFSEGKIVPSIMKLLFDNIRFSAQTYPDILSIKSSLDLGERLVLDSVQKYGHPAFMGTARYVCDASAEIMATALKAIPNGTYEGVQVIDSDGLPESPEYRIKVKIRKFGGRAEFDWSGSSRASRSTLNCAWPDVKTAVIIALKCLIDPYSRLTSGSLRDVDIVLPPDAIMNPSPPHACQFYFEVVNALLLAIFDALNPAIGKNGFGVEAGPSFGFSFGHDDKGPWGGMFSGNYPRGASAFGDGDAMQTGTLNNTIISGVEDGERDSEYITLRGEPLPDSGGPGEHRGGAAVLNDHVALRSGTHIALNFSAKYRTGGGGVAGGKAGRLGGAFFWHPAIAGADPIRNLPASASGKIYQSAQPMNGFVSADTGALDASGTYHPSGTEIFVEKGSLLRAITNGAGGWGDPHRRDPMQVMRDVRDGYVSIAGAARDYGVVVHGDPEADPEGLIVDEAATHLLRSKISA
jgi:N-methylhydantoinase B